MANWNGLCRSCHNKVNKLGKIYSPRKECVDCGKVSRWIIEQGRCKLCLIKFRFQTKENHPRWKGGVSRAYTTGYYSKEYKEWRTTVFERDNFTCQDCGDGGYVTAHHIKSFAHYPELRFELDNGMTLCEPCHSKTDNYKGRGHKLSLTN